MDWIKLDQDRDGGGHVSCSIETSCSII